MSGLCVERDARGNFEESLIMAVSGLHAKPSRELELEWLYARADKAEEEGKLKLAFQLYLALAKSGHELSQLSLGRLYGNGRGVKRSPARALRWEKRAYRHGYSTAALNIGIGYRNEDEPKQSLAWFERALKMGEGAAANFEIGMLLLRTGDVAGAIPHLEEVMKVSPPTFVSEAQWEEAHDILKQLGHGINTHHAKRTERNGRLSDLAWKQWKAGNVRSAIRSFKAAAEGGHFFCQISLGSFYYYGTGVKRNPASAVYWYRRTYRQPIDKATSAYSIAEVYRGQNQIKQALTWFARAGANLEIAKIQLQRGDRSRAIRYFKKVLTTKEPSYVSEADWKEAQRALKQLG
ncbi:MAG TPA: tetratricopeptide repeat protein [Bryobacteraceae bacterium]|nr:tetratricopeptide repeat protein [Bryobacteraceae bacterium]